MVMDDQQRSSDVSLLSPTELHRVLVEFNATEAAYPSELCIHELIENQARKTPDAVAVLFEDRQLTYGQLNARANQVAHHLRELGIGPDARVAICVERSLEMVVGLLGVLKAGGAYVPLDPGYPAQRLAYMLEDSAPAVLLTQQALRSGLPPVAIPVVVLDLQDETSIIARQPEQDLDRAALGLTSRHLAYVIYTSGSTGQPKGVMVEHRGTVNFLTSMAKAPGLTRDDVLLAVTTLSFDIAGLEIYLPLSVGARVVLAGREAASDPDTLIRLLDHHSISVMQATPATWRLLLGRAWKGSPALRVLCGGESLSHELSALLTDRVEAVWNLYGPTEATIWSTLARIDGSLTSRTISIGQPIANTQVYILDAHGQPVPIGVVGEIYIGGAGVARGYLNRPKLTAERFVPDSFGADKLARLYKTGDLGKWRENGNIDYLGRHDFQIKVRGFRIEAGEIEAQLRRCPEVDEAAVIAREDTSGDQRLVAYVTAKAEATLSASALRGQLSAVLPEYMIPSAFVTLEALPLTPNGKLDRKALPAPDRFSVVTREYEAPVGEVETAIAQIWQGLLHLERVGRHDNFFELGGHSLLAVQMLSRTRGEFGLDVSLHEVFARPTPKGMAHALATAGRSAQPVLLPVERGESLPLSFAQERLWFLDQLDHASDAAYHLPVGFRLEGRLDRGALGAALDAIVARHESLRTSFVLQEGRPVQRIAPADAGLRLREHDLSGLSPAAQQAQVIELSRDEAAEAFDLSRGPLIRGELLRLGAEHHVVLLTQHHIVSDGWSAGVFVKELSSLYDAFSQGLANPLPPLKIQYADYAVWQREWLQGELLQRQVEFWKAHLTGAPAVLELPTDRARPALQTYVGGNVEVVLTSQLTAKLRRLSQRHGVTLFMTLLAAWSALLARLSGQSDLVIGTPAANRQHKEVESLIGFFVNTLALRVRLEQDPTVAELLAQIKASTLDAHAHQDVPFAQVVEALQPVRSLSHNPIFQAMLALDNTPAERELRLTDLKVSAVAQTHTTAQFDLTLSLSDTGERIEGALEYASDLFERPSIERMAGYLRTILDAMVTDDQQRISDVSLLSPTELHQVLVEFNATEFNATEAAYPSELCIHELIEDRARKTPDAVAVVFEDRQLTYGQLNVRANQVAHHLRELGIEPDARVAICVERSLEMVVGLLGVLKAGGAYVPLDPGYPAQRLAYMLEDSAPAVLLTQQALRSGLPPVAIPVVVLDLQDETSIIARQPEQDLDRAALGLTSRHLAYVIYTSGSTGQPKGVMVEHHNLVASTLARASLYGEGNRSLLLSSLAFDSSIAAIFGALATSGVLYVSASQLDVACLRKIIDRSQITTLLGVPSVLHVILAEVSGDSMSSLKQVIAGGENCPLSLMDELARVASDAVLYNEYGPTEATIWATVYPCRQKPKGDAIPIGRPIANTQVYILDPQRQPIPIGLTGEIYIAGAGVARGYLNRAELTAERFMNDPFSADPAARMYKTGDVGKWLADGNIAYLGRNDDQIKIRGFRVELGEIEARLRSCAGVLEAVVVAREDSPGGKRLVGYIKFQADAELSGSVLYAQLSKVLPEYMVPSAFVRLDSFPFTPNGKLDRNALPSPSGQSLVAMRRYEAPIGAIETAIAEIWRELLHVERVGRHDNFFELGGHSMLIVRFVEELKKRSQQLVSIVLVYKAPTPAQLAAFIRTANVDEKYKHIVTIRQGGSRNPVYCLHLADGDTSPYLHLARLLDPSIPVYGLVPGYKGEAELTTGALDSLTESYKREMRLMQPEGPYRICGFSFGGPSAFDLATQLEDAGEDVTLILLDAYRLSKTWHVLDWISGAINAVRSKEVIAAIKLRIPKLFIYQNHRWLTGRDKDLTHALHRREKTRRYKHFFGRVVLFKSTETDGNSFQFQLDGCNGWKKYVRGEFEVIHLQTGHLDMVKEPAIHSIVSHLNRVFCD